MVFCLYEDKCWCPTRIDAISCDEYDQCELRTPHHSARARSSVARIRPYRRLKSMMVMMYRSVETCKNLKSQAILSRQNLIDRSSSSRPSQSTVVPSTSSQAPSSICAIINCNHVFCCYSIDKGTNRGRKGRCNVGSQSRSGASRQSKESQRNNKGT
jgi:hypothetical protein